MCAAPTRVGCRRAVVFYALDLALPYELGKAGGSCACSGIVQKSEVKSKECKGAQKVHQPRWTTSSPSRSGQALRICK